MLKQLALATALAVGGLLSAGSAQAIPVVGSTSGTFDNPTGIFTSLSSGDTVFRYGAALSGNASVLSVTGAAFGGSTTLNDATIASLSWTNKLNPLTILNNVFTVDLVLALTLTSPPGGGSTGGGITIVETLAQLGFAPDTLTLPTLLPASITIEHGAGTLTINDFKFGPVTNGTLSGNVWTLSEFKSGSINITADFSNVPEPMTLGLLGLGLAGLGAAARRRRIGA